MKGSFRLLSRRSLKETGGPVNETPRSKEVVRRRLKERQTSPFAAGLLSHPFDEVVKGDRAV